MADRDGPGQGIYTFCVQGELDRDWYDWLEGFRVETCGGETCLTGAIADQAALYGVIGRLRNLGLTLLSVNRCPGNG